MRSAPTRVRGVRLPSRFTSRASLDDAAESAARWACGSTRCHRAAGRRRSKTTLAPLFAGRPRDVTEENLQARVRGVLLMALSNKFGELLVTTGNKSEMSVGYATLYGDMCGGYSVLKDVYKTEVYALSRWRNAHVPEGGAWPARARHPRVVDHQGADRGAAARTRPTRTRCRRTTCSTRSCTGLVEDEQSVDEIVARGFSARRRHARAAPALRGGIQAPAGAAGCEDHAQELRTRPPLSADQRISRT